MTARPFAKAVGGKTSSLPFLLAHAPRKIRTYFEPMVGGGALFFALAAEGRFAHAWLNDANAELMRAYKAVQAHSEELIWTLGAMKNNKKFFLERRADEPEFLPLVERAARFVYLNKTSFNGLWRVNSKGRYNVPFGHYPKPTICDAENLRACAEALRHVDLTSTMGYERTLAGAGPEDFVYFDPPYLPVSKTASFTAFTAGGWKMGDHEQLAYEFGKLAHRGVPVLLSQADVPLARELYRGYRIEATRVRRAVSCKGDGRGKVGEILVLANCGEGAGAIGRAG